MEHNNQIVAELVKLLDKAGYTFVPTKDAKADAARLIKMIQHS